MVFGRAPVNLVLRVAYALWFAPYFAMFAAIALVLRPEQRSIVIGSLLGDGTLAKTTAGYCFRVHHGVGQRGFVEWKFNALRNFVRTDPRVSGRGYYFRTVSHPWCTDLQSAFYGSNGQKHVPLALLSEALDPLALAVWIMDDGSADGRQTRINTQCFAESDCAGLTILLRQKFGLRFTINRDKGRPRLRCASASMPDLLQIVAPHVIPEMRYKLPGLRG